MNSKNYKNLIQVFLLAEVTFSMMNHNISTNFQHFHNASWSYRHNRRIGI